jgi:hypothetical protein
VNPVPESWPLVRVTRGPEALGPATTRIGAGELAFDSGWSLSFDRESRAATLFVPDGVDDDELVHPHLASLARFFSPWLGYESLHGGAFLTGGGAWAVLAARSGGKSTTLARLAGGGVPVLTDDVLVVDREDVLAGPRCIDLREGDLPAVRGGERRRLSLPQVAPAARLRGCFFLDWGDAVRLRPLRPAERLVALARNCLPAEGGRPFLLDLARLPAWRVTRPPSVETLDDVCGRLLDAARD